MEELGHRGQVNVLHPRVPVRVYQTRIKVGADNNFFLRACTLISGMTVIDAAGVRVTCCTKEATT